MWCIDGDSEDRWPPECKQDFETPEEAHTALNTLRGLGFSDLRILRDGELVSENELCRDMISDEFRRDIEEGSVLPTGYRERRSGGADQGVSRDGRKPVWKPDNPENRFDD